jgi:hypothetical protein
MSKRWMTALLLALLATHAGAQATKPARPSYTADITRRADEIVQALGIDDPAKAARVRTTLVDQYRALRDLHDTRDATLKNTTDDAVKAQIKAASDADVKDLHQEFITKLSADLTPEQIERVKDKLTYNVVHVTYNAFQDMLPTLTDEQKAYILAQLTEAREIAMDQGSSREKHAVFGKYKGRINNYLAKQGYDLKQANKEWAERRKAREASEKQQPAQKQD